MKEKTNLWKQQFWCKHDHRMIDLFYGSSQQARRSSNIDDRRHSRSIARFCCSQLYMHPFQDWNPAYQCAPTCNHLFDWLAFDLCNRISLFLIQHTLATRKKLYSLKWTEYCLYELSHEMLLPDNYKIIFNDLFL